MNIKPTKEQKNVNKSKDPITALVSPYGTGKTEVIAWFVLERLRGNKYKRIVLVTFTRSAADTMKERLEIYGASPNHASIKVGTLHSFVLGQLFQYAHLIGFRQNLHIKSSITDKLLKKLIKKYKKQLIYLRDPLKILREINKRHVRSNKRIIDIAQEVFQEENKKINKLKLISKILSELKEDKKQFNMMDYDDMLYYFYILLRNNASVARSIVRKYPLMIVDEFQDTSDIQWKFIKLLIDQGIHLLAAGDPYQTLYRFAGANLKRFERLNGIPKCRKFELTENHRTTKQIIELSNAIRVQLKPYQGSNTWSKRNGPKPQVIFSNKKGSLVKTILEKIRNHHEKDDISLNDMAVCYRFDKDADYFSKQLVLEKVPYIKFNKEGSDRYSDPTNFIISVIKISQNKGNRKLWRTILPCLSGIGKKGIQMILDYLKEHNYAYQGIRDMTGNRYKNELERLMKLFWGVDLLKCNPLKILRATIVFYSKRRKIKNDDPYVSTMLNIAQKSEDIEEFLLKYRDTSYGIYHPFDRNNKSKEFLTLCNIHKIKGKGFKVVFILGSYDHNFKGFKTFDDQSLINDEIMIMDTAITRSSCYLYFLFPMTHKAWNEKHNEKNPSIFIRNCPRELYDLYSVKSPDKNIRE